MLYINKGSMKKVLVVLLIAVLAMSAVFAEFGGSYTTDLKYDLKEQVLSLGQTAKITGKFAFSFFNGESASVAQSYEEAGYPYVVVEGDLGISFEGFEFDFNNQSNTRYKETKDFWAYQIQSPAKDAEIIKAKSYWFTTYEINKFAFEFDKDSAEKVFTKVAIVGEDWELNLLNNTSVGNLAKNEVGDAYRFVASDYVNSSVVYGLDNSTKAGNGVTFTYKDYSVSLNQFVLGSDASKNMFELSLAANDFNVAENVTVASGLNYKNVAGNNSINGSVKVSYADEEIASSVATDVQLGLSGTATQFDLAAGVNYKDAVTADVYYASAAKASNPYYAGTYKTKLGGTTEIETTDYSKLNKAVFNLSFDQKNAKYTLAYKNSGDKITAVDPVNEVSVEKLLSAKATIDVAKLATLGEVSTLSVALDGHDIANKNSFNAYNFEVNAAMENYGVTAKAGMKDFTDKDNYVLYAEVFNDFAKVAKLPVQTLTLKVGSENVTKETVNYLPVSTDKVAGYADRLYFAVDSQIDDTLKLGLTGNELIGEYKTVKFGVNATYTGVEKLTLSASASHEFAGSDKATALEAKSVYDGEIADVTAVLQAKLYGDGTTKANVGAYIGATSDQVVHGATLTLAYGEYKSNKVTVDWNNNELGSFLASCRIEF